MSSSPWRPQQNAANARGFFLLPSQGDKVISRFLWRDVDGDLTAKR